MIERNAGVPEDRRIEFRVGIHVGDVVEESDGDLMGDGVNIAARLEGIAKPGAICLSEDAYRQVSGRLEMEVTDLGPTQLKNIDRQIRAYSLQVGVPAKPKPTKPAEPVTPAAPTPQKRRFGLAPLAAALAALLVVVAGGAWWLLDANRPASVAAKAPAEAARLSIVVLPFANLSGDPGQDYLVDALTDELTTSLARIRGTFVIARNTAMTFKGKPIDAKAIGKDLGVRYVLEGSVQPSGDQMRVNAQLIDADSGAHLWAEQFDTPRADLLQTQDAIVTHLANAIDFQLTRPRPPVSNGRPRPIATPRTWLSNASRARGRAGFIGKEADAAYALCEQALAIDPNNVRALTVIGWKFLMPAVLGVSGDPKGDFERADEFASKALALDPDFVSALVRRAGSFGSGRAEEAVAEFERALALDPSTWTPTAGLGVDYVRSGNSTKASKFSTRRFWRARHDPSLTCYYGGKAWANFGLKNYDQTIELVRWAIAINPMTTRISHVYLVAALALTGHDTGARAALAELPRAALHRAVQDDRGI